jgi:hypothetical protein
MEESEDWENMQVLMGYTISSSLLALISMRKSKK